MNIKDFLIDNYIWIIVILVITIITIIGFLADKNSKDKQKREQNNNNANSVPGAIPVQNMNTEQMNNQGVIQYQQVAPMKNQTNNNMEMVYNNENNQIPPVVNQPQSMPNNQELVNTNTMNMAGESRTMVNNTTIPTDANLINNPQPVENITPNLQEEPIYQPLSEQTPHIKPQPVPNFSNIANNNQEIQQPINNGLNQNNGNVVSMETPVQQMSQPVVDQPIIGQTPNYNQQTPIAQSMPNNNSNYGMNMVTPMPNFNQNNVTIPSQVSPIPTPQPVNPQPIMQNAYNNGQPLPQQNYGGMMQQPSPQPMNSQPTTQSTTPQPINFVFGPQNNNQNM